MSTAAARLRGRPAHPDADAAFDPRLVAPLVLGAILNPVNSSIIAVSLVPIGHALGAPASQTAWLVSALYVATAVGQPLVGRLIDAYGPRRLYLVGTALVGVAGIVGALAPSLGVLIAARALLGLGTCAGYPAAMSLIRSEAARTGRESPAGILTVLAISTQTIAVIGPSLGGLLIGIGGWRATLAVNVPLAVVGLALGLLRLPKRSPADRTPATSERPPGSALRSLVGNRPLLATYGRALLTAVVSYAFLYGFTQWLEDGRGLSPSTAGLVLLPMFAVGIVVAALTGRRPEVRGKLVVGSAAQVVVCGLLLVLGDGSPMWLLIVVALILGIPQGLNTLANQNALFHQADADRIGLSAGLLRTFGYVGAIVASAAGGLVFGPDADTPGLHHLALFMLAAALLFLALSTLDRDLGRVGRDPADGAAADGGSGGEPPAGVAGGPPPATASPTTPRSTA